MVRLNAKYSVPTIAVLETPRLFYIERPTTADVYPLVPCNRHGRVLGVSASTDAGTVTFNIERRTAIGTSGIALFASALVGASTPVSLYALVGGGAVIPGEVLVVVPSSVSGAPRYLFLTLEYLFDE